MTLVIKLMQLPAQNVLTHVNILQRHRNGELAAHVLPLLNQTGSGTAAILLDSTAHRVHGRACGAAAIPAHETQSTQARLCCDAHVHAGIIASGLGISHSRCGVTVCPCTACFHSALLSHTFIVGLAGSCGRTWVSRFNQPTLNQL